MRVNRAYRSLYLSPGVRKKSGGKTITTNLKLLNN